MTGKLRARIRLWCRFFVQISYPRDLPIVWQGFLHRRSFSIPDETWTVIAEVNGFLSRKEAGLLYWAAREWPVAGSVIELGSYGGRSTLVFAFAGRCVHAIDAWSATSIADQSAYRGGVSADTVFNNFMANLSRTLSEECVTIHRGLTHHVGREWGLGKGAILFVDAGHTYADVRNDLEVWTPHLHSRGLLIMHDVLGDAWLGVTHASGELLQRGWRVVASAGSAVAFERTGNV